MVWLASIVLLLLTGYSLLWLLGMSQRHVLADVAASWFAGSGYLALASLAWTLGLRQAPALWASLVIMCLPVLLLLVLQARYRAGMRESLAAFRVADCLPQEHRAVYAIFGAVALATLALLVLHGKNTPTNTCDGANVRAYTAMLVCQGLINAQTIPQILSNGIYASFVPVLGWQLQGEINHFHANIWC